ncbi:MAG: methyl-accepting chemotaxis protein, partial [Acidovorax sp.]
MSLLKSLKGQILALSSACLVLALLVLTVANFLVARSQARDSLIEESLATAKSHVETIEEWGRGKALVVAASVAAFDDPEPVKTLALLRDAGKFSTFYFGFADKKYVFSETRNLPADYDPTARPWYKQAAAAGGPVITPPYISASDGKLVVTFASPVGAGSALKGVAAGDVSMESVVATVSSVRPTPQSFGFMASSDGKIIAHPDAALTLKPLTDLAPALTSDKLQAAAKSRELLGIEIGGRQRLLTVVPIAGTSWMLVVALDESEALAPIRAMLTTSVVSSIVVLAIAVALLAAVLTQRLRRLTQVRDAMHEVGEGDGDLSRRIDTHGEDELAQIASSYNNFAGKLSGVLGQIREASGSVRVAAEEIATGNQDLSGRTELTASSLQETSASMQQLTETVRQNADAAR